MVQPALSALSLPCTFAAGHHRPHLEDGNHRQHPDEQEEQRDEQANRAEEGHDVPARRPVHPPRRGQEVAVQAGDDDHEALEPHADVDEHRNEEQHRRASSGCS